MTIHPTDPAYVSNPMEEMNYSSKSTADAGFATEEKAAQDYADKEGQGTLNTAKGLSDDNKTEAELKHKVPVKAIPRIIENQKSAHLLNWDDRTYQVDIKTQVNYEFGAADPFVLLILDDSGSMDDGEGSPKEVSMKNSATKLITDLSTKVPDAQVGVISFNDYATELQAFTRIGNKNVADTINTEINNLETVNGTRTDLAFKMAYEMLKEKDGVEKPVYIMFLTDGVPTNGTTSFHNKTAADAESYRSLILGLTEKRPNNEAIKGKFESYFDNSYGVSVTTTTPALNFANATIYSVLQGDSYGGVTDNGRKRGKDFMDFIANPDSNSILTGSTPLSDIFQDFFSEIVGAQVVDTLDPHFELAKDEKERLEAAGATVDYDEESGKTKITWSAAVNKLFTTSFKIKAKNDYIGENVVPTNVPDESGIIINKNSEPTDKPTPFDIFDKDGKVDDLSTPYVNVKLKDFKVKNTDETIWLGTIASTQADIFTGWKNTVTTPDAGADGAEYPTPVFSKDPDKLTGYVPKPLTEKTYTDTATATADTYAKGNTAAEAYAEGYGLGGVTAGKGETNKVSKDVEHKVYLKTDDVDFAKRLNGEEIRHEYGATFDIVEPAGYPDASVSFVRANTNDSYALEISGLGVGTYTINETTPKGIREASWELVVSVNPNDSTKLIYTIDGEEVTFLNNEWNDFKIRVHKKDDLGQALLGAEFTLTNVTDPDSPGPPVPLGTDGKLSTFDFGGLAPGTYELKETKTPKGHTGLAGSITILIGEDGVVKIDNVGEEWNVEEGSNVITLNVTNKVKGVLPSTGGPGR